MVMCLHATEYDGESFLFFLKNRFLQYWGRQRQDAAEISDPAPFGLRMSQRYLSVVNLKSCLACFRYNPDVVFLQEVIPPHLCLLQMRAGSYTIIPGTK